MCTSLWINSSKILHHCVSVTWYVMCILCIRYDSMYNTGKWVTVDFGMVRRSEHKEQISYATAGANHKNYIRCTKLYRKEVRAECHIICNPHIPIIKQEGFPNKFFTLHLCFAANRLVLLNATILVIGVVPAYKKSRWLQHLETNEKNLAWGRLKETNNPIAQLVLINF